MNLSHLLEVYEQTKGAKDIFLFYKCQQNGASLLKLKLEWKKNILQEGEILQNKFSPAILNV